MRDLRFFAILSLLIAFTLKANAQLTVDYYGKTGIIMSTPLYWADLSVGSSDGYSYPSYDYGIWTNKYGIRSFNIGVKGYATNSSQTGRTIGVQGLGGSGAQGWNYGVIGGLGSTRNGAGIFGTLNNHTGVCINGRYAGYFDGSVRITDTLTVSTIVTPSDIRLKENIAPLETSEEGCALSKLMDMNVISYNYKAHTYEDSDTASEATKAMRFAEQQKVQHRHFGLSAQELQEIYPELVYEGQDGYLGVNYTELVPILIRSIQELKAELDKVKGKNSDDAKSRVAGFEEEETTSVTDATSIPAVATLAQNTPNPFSERTTIRFTLPENTQNAFIYIFDMSGKMQKQISVTTDMQSITIEGYELRAGMYIYSLVVGGKEIDTKRMIITK